MYGYEGHEVLHGSVVYKRSKAGMLLDRGLESMYERFDGLIFSSRSPKNI
jgi:hypothetical protein